MNYWLIHWCPLYFISVRYCRCALAWLAIRREKEKCRKHKIKCKILAVAAAEYVAARRALEASRAAAEGRRRQEREAEDERIRQVMLLLHIEMRKKEIEKQERRNEEETKVRMECEDQRSRVLRVVVLREGKNIAYDLMFRMIKENSRGGNNSNNCNDIGSNSNTNYTGHTGYAGSDYSNGGSYDDDGNYLSLPMNPSYSTELAQQMKLKETKDLKMRAMEMKMKEMKMKEMKMKEMKLREITSLSKDFDLSHFLRLHDSDVPTGAHTDARTDVSTSVRAAVRSDLKNSYDDVTGEKAGTEADKVEELNDTPERAPGNILEYNRSKVRIMQKKLEHESGEQMENLLRYHQINNEDINENNTKNILHNRDEKGKGKKGTSERGEKVGKGGKVRKIGKIEKKSKNRLPGHSGKNVKAQEADFTKTDLRRVSGVKGDKERSEDCDFDDDDFIRNMQYHGDRLRQNQQHPPERDQPAHGQRTQIQPRPSWGPGFTGHLTRPMPRPNPPPHTAYTAHTVHTAHSANHRATTPSQATYPSEHTEYPQYRKEFSSPSEYAVYADHAECSISSEYPEFSLNSKCLRHSQPLKILTESARTDQYLHSGDSVREHLSDIPETTTTFRYGRSGGYFSQKK